MTTTVTQTVPVQATVTLEQAPELPPADHVRMHGPRCYWDFRECRWECSRD
jgi:hypothetical protein